MTDGSRSLEEVEAARAGARAARAQAEASWPALDAAVKTAHRALDEVRVRALAGPVGDPAADYKRLLVLCCPKPNMAEQPDPIFLERVRNAQGPVLQLTIPRQKETDPAAKRANVFAFIATSNEKGEALSLRSLKRNHAAELGCTQREVEDIVKNALDGGQLEEGDKVKGGGKALRLKVTQ
jgi:hypothetical protein